MKSKDLVDNFRKNITINGRHHFTAAQMEFLIHYYMLTGETERNDRSCVAAGVTTSILNEWKKNEHFNRWHKALKWGEIEEIEEALFNKASEEKNMKAIEMVLKYNHPTYMEKKEEKKSEENEKITNFTFIIKNNEIERKDGE